MLSETSFRRSHGGRRHTPTPGHQYLASSPHDLPFVSVSPFQRTNIGTDFLPLFHSNTTDQINPAR